MPIYEYECTQCKKIVEELQKVSNGKNEKVCPICFGKMKKIISKSTFHLKGTGWYATDYKNKQKG
jgi:putative FmdB family regulatory protein